MPYFVFRIFLALLVVGFETKASVTDVTIENNK